MDKTPKISKSSSHNNGTVNDCDTTDNRLCYTPTLNSRIFPEMENDDSPIHIACTQEGCENIDVIWDWNSPQAKQKPKKSHKRLIMPQSPKIPIKRHPSNNYIPNFDKLREELQSLREAIAQPDNEESLLLSPLEESEYKHVKDDENINDVPPTQESYVGRDEDLFEDPIDKMLVEFTQKVEEDLEAAEINVKQHKTNLTNNSESQNIKKVQIEDTRSVTNKKKIPHTKYFDSKIEDTFDNAFKIGNVENLGMNKDDPTKTNNNRNLKCNSQLAISRTKSEYQCTNSRKVAKVEFHRTQSFESTMEYTKEVIPKFKLDEIERKRKQALAKLESKRKQESSDSPSKCSPEEIEQKRLQALAKLEAKRQQEFIERKRQEALKRLQLNRKKNAIVVKSSLTKRL